MSLRRSIDANKATILQRWFDLILASYPAETRRFLKRQKNRFTNPVASEISQGIEGILDQLLGDGPIAAISPFLDRIIRIRAVQELSPSAALGFLFALKDIVREVLGDDLDDGAMFAEWAGLERRIDAMGLLALDLYMNCRAKLYELRVKEIKNRVGGLLRMADLVVDLPETGADNADTNRDPLT